MSENPKHSHENPIPATPIAREIQGYLAGQEAIELTQKQKDDLKKDPQALESFMTGATRGQTEQKSKP